MSCIETPNGRSHLWCGVCRYGFLLMAKEAIDISNKQINMLKEEIEKIGGEKPPGGNSMPMDPELKLINKSNF